MDRRKDVLGRMQEVMGELPDSSKLVDLDIKVLEESSAGRFVRRKITFASEPGDRCIAWLLIPKDRLAANSKPGPAMLCLHQTTPIGKDEPAGIGGLPNLHYARELAERGYVTLAPDYPYFGEYRINPYALGYASGIMKGIWNHMRAVDLLAQMPQVDAARIGCIGHSMGGHNSLFLSAFDTRMAVTVTSCGFTRFRWNNDDGRGEFGDVRDWSAECLMPRVTARYGNRAENMPFDFNEVLEIIAPRPLFINGTTKDFMTFRGVRECIELTEPVFAKYSASEHFEWIHPECEHDFPLEARERAYKFIDRFLG